MVGEEAGMLDAGRPRPDSQGVNVEQIRERLQGAFRPFTIITSSGHKFPVPHPEFILITPRVVVIANQEGYTVNVDPLHIVGLQEIPPRRKTRKR